MILLLCGAATITGCDEEGDTDCQLFGDCDGSGGGGGSLCSNSCGTAYDGECDDGGPGADYSVCDCGTDCYDCGTRSSSDCGGSGGSTQIMVWTDADWGCGAIAVYVDGSYAGSVSSYYSSTPSCGSSGCVTVSVTPGSHSMSASCSSFDWPASYYSVSSGNCLSIRLN